MPTAAASATARSPAVGQAAVAQLLGEWLPRWTDARRMSEDAQIWDIGGAELPRITLKMLDKVLASYKEGMGLGADRLHPESLLLFPVDYRTRLIDLFHGWEKDPQRLLILLTKFTLWT